MERASATSIFDAVASNLLPFINQENRRMIKDTLKILAIELEDGDWDCQNESEYFEHPLVQEIFLELGTIREDGE